MEHNKLTFTAEYCRARRIPYSIKREALFVKKFQVCYSLYCLTYSNIIDLIDNVCEYDEVTTYFKNLHF